ncbi:hypothetical protein Tco_0425236 [Tanacetum coccineum]
MCLLLYLVEIIRILGRAILPFAAMARYFSLLCVVTLRVGDDSPIYREQRGNAIVGFFMKFIVRFLTIESWLGVTMPLGLKEGKLAKFAAMVAVSSYPIAHLSEPQNNKMSMFPDILARLKTLAYQRGSRLMEIQKEKKCEDGNFSPQLVPGKREHDGSFVTPFLEKPIICLKYYQGPPDLNIPLTSMKKKNRTKSIAKKPKKNEDVQKETEIISPTKETTPKHENTPTRRTKANAARRLTLENPIPTENPPTTPSSNVNPTPTTTIQEPTNETNQQPPSTNVDTTPQKKQIFKTQTTYHQKTRGSAKKQQLEKKGKEPLKKRKRVEKPKNKAEERKKMDKKGKKKLEVDDEDYEIEEP